MDGWDGRQCTRFVSSGVGAGNVHPLRKGEVRGDPCDIPFIYKRKTLPYESRGRLWKNQIPEKGWPSPSLHIQNLETL
uniref:Uncharacterized protein n=2 Tax=Oryza TaxID=4527 RepID=Q6YYW7_ORYSJ|nr:hypothetical protein [Oryza sativa Japonica Group]